MCCAVLHPSIDRAFEQSAIVSATIAREHVDIVTMNTIVVTGVLRVCICMVGYEVYATKCALLLPKGVEEG